MEVDRDYCSNFVFLKLVLFIILVSSWVFSPYSLDLLFLVLICQNFSIHCAIIRSFVIDGPDPILYHL